MGVYGVRANTKPNKPNKPNSAYSGTSRVASTSKAVPCILERLRSRAPYEYCSAVRSHLQLSARLRRHIRWPVVLESSTPPEEDPRVPEEQSCLDLVGRQNKGVDLRIAFCANQLLALPKPCLAPPLARRTISTSVGSTVRTGAELCHRCHRPT